eukprot:2491419-Pleurochrysis_carterae.AAC.1
MPSARNAAESRRLLIRSREIPLDCRCTKSACHMECTKPRPKRLSWAGRIGWEVGGSNKTNCMHWPTSYSKLEIVRERLARHAGRKCRKYVENCCNPQKLASNTCLAVTIVLCRQANY